MNTIPEIFIELLALEHTKQKFGQLDPKKRVERKDELISLNKQINIKLEESKNMYLKLDFKTRSEVIDYFDIKEYKLIYSKLDKKLPVEPTIKKSTIEDEKKVQSSRQKRDAHRIVQSINNWMKTYNSEEKDKELSFLTKNIFRSNYVNPSIYADKDNSILVFSILLCIKELERRTSDINQNLIYRNAIKKICYYFQFTELPGESEYHGQIRDDLFDGFGVKIDKKYTDVYIGEFQKDRRAGFGLQVYDNGDFYYGEFQNDLRHGYGHYFWSDGEEYECNWLNGDQVDETPNKPDIIDPEPTSPASPKEVEFNKTLPPFELILKEFKDAHAFDFRILETNNEDLNNLIRMVVMDNHISEIEKQFLIEKTKELNLSNTLIQQAEDYLETDNPFLDKIFKLIFNDGIVSQNELDFVHEKTQEINLNKEIVNRRFWDYAIHFHLDNLIDLKPFKNWIVAWYIYREYLTHIEPYVDNTAQIFNIYTGNDFELILSDSLAKIEKHINSSLPNNLTVNELYELIFAQEDEIYMDLNKVSDLHKDALCWFSNNESNTITYLEVNGEKVFNTGQTFLFNSAKGIHKPAGWDFALSIKVLMDSPYDDQIKETLNGNWTLKYHKEDDNEWTNEGLIKCMENKIPVGLFYQIKERDPSTYKIYGLGLINHFDGEYFHISSIHEDDKNYFDWDPELQNQTKTIGFQNRALIIDEDKVMANSIRDILHFEGISTRTSTNIASAFSSTKPVNSNSFKYDFIICDINAPIVGEINLLGNETRRINKTGAIHLLKYLELFKIHQPVVVISNDHTTIEEEKQLYESEAFEIIKKPLDLNLFLSILKKVDGNLKNKNPKIGQTKSQGGITIKKPILENKPKPKIDTSNLEPWQIEVIKLHSENKGFYAIRIIRENLDNKMSVADCKEYIKELLARN